MRKLFFGMSLAAVGVLSGQEAGKIVKVDPALDAIVPAGAKIEKLAGGLVFTEGPLWMHDGGGYLLFSDVPGNGADIGGKRHQGYKDWKRRIADKLINRISVCAKDLLGQFELLDIASPLTFREKLCNPGGSIYGVKHRITDMPLLPRTAIKGFYLSGQSIIAPGVLGAMCSSFLTERFITG